MSRSLLTLLPTLITQSQNDVRTLINDIQSTPQHSLFGNEPQLIPCLKENNNQLYQGDNLLVMASLVANARSQHNSIDLIYVEPTFSKKSASEHNQLILELTNLLPRLILMIKLLKPGGALFCHLNWRTAPWVRVILDELLGSEQCVNEIIWQTHPTEDALNTGFAHAHDTLLFYRKPGAPAYWQDTFQAYSANSQSQYRQRDEKGTFQLVPVDNPGGNGYRYDLGLGEKIPRNGYRMPEATARQWLADGSLVVRAGRVSRRKHYLQLPGVKCRDIWTDIPRIQAQESLQFPSQKPRALLERILLSASPSNGLVADFYAGSATLAVTAQRLGRRFISCDISPAAHLLALRRLLINQHQPHSFHTLSDFSRRRVLSVETQGTAPSLASRIFDSLSVTPLLNKELQLALCTSEPNTLLWLKQPNQPVSTACLQQAITLTQTNDHLPQNIVILAWHTDATFSEAYNSLAQDNINVYLLPTSLLDETQAQVAAFKNIALQPLPRFKSAIRKVTRKTVTSYALKIEQYHLAKTNVWPTVHQQRHESALSWQDVVYWAIDTHNQSSWFKPTHTWLKPLKSRQALTASFHFKSDDNIQLGQRLSVRVINHLGQESRAICMIT